MELKFEGKDYSIYRCPSCENFYTIDDWSEENDVCEPCMQGIEFPPPEEEEDEEEPCFICNNNGSCVCDERTDAYKEFWMDDNE